MLHADAASVNVDHSTFYASHFCAISSHPSYEVTLADMAWTDFTSSVYNGHCIRSTSLVANATWNETEVPYVVLDDVTIPIGFTLSWSPGIVIKPAHGAVSFVVDGTLNASGSSGSPVFVTSINDDATGGNTNNNANPANPGDWDRVWFRDGSSGSLNLIDIHYGGDAGGNLAAIHIENASPIITNCRLRLNVRGMSSSGLSANPIIHYCFIEGNTEYGVFNVTSGHWIDARYNWWNSDSGPYDPSPPGTDGDYNQTGTGDRVNDYVLYRPWIVLEYLYLPLTIR